MSIHVIVNPHAAYGSAAQLWPRIRLQLEHQGIRLVEHFTQGMMHATSIAGECIQNKASNIICVGGDGTLNEVVNGMLQSGVDRDHLPTLSMIPVGTGSDFSRTIGISKDIDQAVATTLRGKVTDIDVGEVLFESGQSKWTRYFINVIDIGLGGKVVRIVNRMPKNLGGFLTFLVSSLVALVTFRHMDIDIEVDQKHVDQGLMWIVGAANGQYFGGGMHMAPMARIDDGLLEILYVKDTSIFKFIVHILGKVYDGKHLDYHNVYHHQGRKIHIKSPQPCLIDIDGEEDKAYEVSISIIPKALKITIP
jgi:diacylglycerol kinase (ATP)